MTLEISLETRSLELLRVEGAATEKLGQDGRPDRLVLWGGGRHFWIEFKKAKTGRIRPGQKTFSKYLWSIGDEVHFIDTYQQLVELVETWKLIHGKPTASRDRAFRKLG